MAGTWTWFQNSATVYTGTRSDGVVTVATFTTSTDWPCWQMMTKNTDGTDNEGASFCADSDNHIGIQKADPALTRAAVEALAVSYTVAQLKPKVVATIDALIP